MLFSGDTDKLTRPPIFFPLIKGGGYLPIIKTFLAFLFPARTLNASRHVQVKGTKVRRELLGVDMNYEKEPSGINNSFIPAEFV